MHLLTTQPGADVTEGEPVVLDQAPGDFHFLSFADSELRLMTQAVASLSTAGRSGSEAQASAWTVRVANLQALTHPFSVDCYVEQTLSRARMVLVRLLGGASYWPYGLSALTDWARRGRARGQGRGQDVFFIPLAAEGRQDATLSSHTVLPADLDLPGDVSASRVLAFLDQAFAESGSENFTRILEVCFRLLEGRPFTETEAAPHRTAKAGVFHRQPALDSPALDSPAPGLGGRPGTNGEAAPGRVLILLYRYVIQSGQEEVFKKLALGLARQGLASDLVYIVSHKDALSCAFLGRWLAEHPPELILDATGFSAAQHGENGAIHAPLEKADCPVLQIMLSSQSREQWLATSAGLVPRDIAMFVALTELDGKIFTRPVGFKEASHWEETTACFIKNIEPDETRITFIAQLAARWIALIRTKPAAKKIAFIVSNAPASDARLANGVGLDVPQALVRAFAALQAEGYALGDNWPQTGEALMDELRALPTNENPKFYSQGLSVALETYEAFFQTLPDVLQEAVLNRWGAARSDPFFDTERGRFALSLRAYGNIYLGIQPARGYHIDIQATWHDPALVPPHGYLAFYGCLRETVDALVHFGKHGTLEWLPGKALALGPTCWPEAVLGPMPVFYPFIVNDPGEGSQAKRRASSVILDHMTPPLARAEAYGPQLKLEGLVEEYYQAQLFDAPRSAALSDQILALAQKGALAHEAEIRAGDTRQEALVKLDAYLCELKERQIRNGLHVYGRSPSGPEKGELLVALTRQANRDLPSFFTVLWDALELGPARPEGFPAIDDYAQPWEGPLPDVLRDLAPQSPVRHYGHLIERLEWLALRLVQEADTAAHTQAHTTNTGHTIERTEPHTGMAPAVPAVPAVRKLANLPPVQAFLARLSSGLERALDSVGPDETAGLKRALAGRFVEPGPSGAPTRGRHDVFPMGRNFYAVDIRGLPTPTAWQLGWASAQLFVETYLQTHGAYPRRLALSAWGSACMRTGGDDVAQMLAFMGARPCWAEGSGRVTGTEILPLSVLGRPRLDVTLRLSGFFRDAFPNLLLLLDETVQKIAQLEDEPFDMNPLREARCARTETEAGGEGGDGLRRLFGAKPGAYGAGLQALIDSGAWQTRADLAEAWLQWGSYSYGKTHHGELHRDALTANLARVDAVLHNQDNQEHDLLDSDDYYQFEGGLAAVTAELQGRSVPSYHADHATPAHPRMRTLEQEISRVVRARAANPKWIQAMMRHGYKGAFEMVATLDYLFGFSATTDAVRTHHYEQLFEAWLEDPNVVDFLRQHNPHALRDLVARFEEARERGLWRTRRNTLRPATADLEGADPATSSPATSGPATSGPETSGPGGRPQPF